MSDEINDDDAKSFEAAQIPVATMYSLVEEIAKSGQFTLEGKKHMGSELLYPFYGGHEHPSEIVSGITFFPSTVVVRNKEKANAIYSGQAAIVIINLLPTPLKVTRPYRDGGHMLGVPEFSGKKNVIPPWQDGDKGGLLGIGSYLNDNASIFYGAGAVLKFQPEDSKYPAFAMGYSSGSDGGYGAKLTNNVSDISDPEKWFDNNADKLQYDSGATLLQRSKELVQYLSMASDSSMDRNFGGLFTLLVTPDERDPVWEKISNAFVIEIPLDGLNLAGEERQWLKRSMTIKQHVRSRRAKTPEAP